jgi:predicted RNA-binding protein (virulence factor B family)
MNNLKRYAITYKKKHNTYYGSNVYGSTNSEHTEVIMASNEEEARRIGEHTFGNIIRIRED